MAEVTWQCEKCGNEIADGEGVLRVSMAAVERHIDAKAAWRRQFPGTGHTMDELGKLPAAVPWQSVHTACDSLESEGTYLIEVERLRTPWDLVAWTSQVLSKTWISNTDWSHLLRRKHAEGSQATQ